MKKLTLGIAFLAISMNCFAQRYYDYVLKAESAVIDSSYTVALDIYKDLFRKYNGRLAEYYNALLCATFTNKPDIAFDYLKKCIEGGADRAFLDNNFLKSLKSDQRWNQLMEKEFESLQAKYLSYKKSPMVNALDSLDKIDQACSIEKRSGMDSVYFLNMKKLHQLIGVYGYPAYECFQRSTKKVGGNCLPVSLFRHYGGAINRAKYYGNEVTTTYLDSIGRDNKFMDWLLELNGMGLITPLFTDWTMTYSHPDNILNSANLLFIRYTPESKTRYDINESSPEALEVFLVVENADSTMMRKGNRLREQIGYPSLNDASRYNMFNSTIRKRYKESYQQYFSLSFQMIYNRVEEFCSAKEFHSFMKDVSQKRNGKITFMRLK